MRGFFDGGTSKKFERMAKQSFINTKRGLFLIPGEIV
jgi:hypothetical protein